VGATENQGGTFSGFVEEKTKSGARNEVRKDFGRRPSGEMRCRRLTREKKKERSQVKESHGGEEGVVSWEEGNNFQSGNEGNQNEKRGINLKPQQKTGEPGMGK